MFSKIEYRTLKYKAKDLPTEAKGSYILPALTAGIQNQGLNNYVPVENATILKNIISISANGANTGATFYQSHEFTILQDAYAIKWIYSNDILTDNQYLFLVGAITKTIYGNYEWTKKAGWERIKNDKIRLPLIDNQIDFEFMESFIADIENEKRIKLKKYLSVTGLKDYKLTREEQKALEDYNDLNFDKINITKIFNIKNTKNILSSSIMENSGDTPYLCASKENNSVNSYISYDKKYIDKGNCIFIAGKTFVVTYQNKDFYSNDSHNLCLSLKAEDKKDKFVQLFLTTCIDKSLSYKYSWGGSISKCKIQDDIISIPLSNNEPIYKYMHTLISAIEKQIIKDVVLYTNKKMKATKSIVK